MRSTEPKCCLELDIDPMDLIFPERVSERGREFMNAMDVSQCKIGDLIDGALDLKNGQVKLRHRCSKLNADGSCSIYDNRPVVCREWTCNGKECGFCSTKYEEVKTVTATKSMPSHVRASSSKSKTLSILIPARNEMFLKRTIEDILSNIEADTNIIAVCDGSWPFDPIPQHPRVDVIYHSKSLGQRAATNEAARLSQADFIMKVDAHCSFDKGFDRKMLEGFDKVGRNVTMVPVMRNLWVFDWKCYKCGHKKYQGPTPEKCGDPKCDNVLVYQGLDDPPEALRKAIRRKVVWVGKNNPQSTSYCFDSEPHFQYFEDYKHRDVYRNDKESTGFTETMSLQGSCFMCTRDKYWELNLCDEELGSWGNQGIEVAVKTWLSGGRVLVNHSTWYAHMFRTQGGDFSFPYEQSGRQVAKCKQKVKDLFFNNKWGKQVHPLSWLLDRFWPVKGWTDESLRKLKEGIL
jgi:Fe-S-cluster containining protein/glycosyltransferase involved in cell wall biosynthesis